MALRDKRYSVNREWAGQPKPVFVVRFCDTWVTSRNTRDQAEKIVARLKKGGVTNITPELVEMLAAEVD